MTTVLVIIGLLLLIVLFPVIWVVGMFIYVMGLMFLVWIVGGKVVISEGGREVGYVRWFTYTRY